MRPQLLELRAAGDRGVRAGAVGRPAVREVLAGGGMSVYADPSVRGKGARSRVKARRRAEAQERQRLERLRDAMRRPAPDPPVPSWYRAGHDELPRLVPAPVSVELLLGELLLRELLEVG